MILKKELRGQWKIFRKIQNMTLIHKAEKKYPFIEMKGFQNSKTDYPLRSYSNKLLIAKKLLIVFGSKF